MALEDRVDRLERFILGEDGGGLKREMEDIKRDVNGIKNSLAVYEKRQAAFDRAMFGDKESMQPGMVERMSISEKRQLYIGVALAALVVLSDHYDKIGAIIKFAFLVP
jgi:hypothetical protein